MLYFLVINGFLISTLILLQGLAVSHHIIFEIIMCNATFQSNINRVQPETAIHCQYETVLNRRAHTHIHAYCSSPWYCDTASTPHDKPDQSKKNVYTNNYYTIHNANSITNDVYLHHVNAAHIYLHACQRSTHTFTRAHMHRPLPPPHDQGCSIFGTFSCPTM